LAQPATITAKLNPIRDNQAFFMTIIIPVRPKTDLAFPGLFSCRFTSRWGARRCHIR